MSVGASSSSDGRGGPPEDEVADTTTCAPGGGDCGGGDCDGGERGGGEGGGEAGGAGAGDGTRGTARAAASESTTLGGSGLRSVRCNQRSIGAIVTPATLDSSGMSSRSAVANARALAGRWFGSLASAFNTKPSSAGWIALC